jgi:DNA-binding ferritin-like protein
MTMKKYLKKRIIPAGLSLILIIMTVISIMPINVSAEDSLNVIEISRVNELIEFANKCKYDSYSKDKIVKLTADIDVSGSDFKGISYFAGTFDGGSHIISGFNVDYKGSDFGFFRYIAESGFITNLNISGSINVTGSQENIGGIAGVNKGVINESSFSGKVNASTATGAIAGYNHENAKIVSCTSDADILATNQTGGIAGVNDGLISSCTSKSRVNTQELDTTLDIGGVDVGTLNLTQNVIDRNDMGGIAGESTGIISDCVNYGKIGFAHTGYNVGGIAGKQSGKVITCSNEGEIYGRKDVGGIVGQAEPDIESEYLNDRVDDVQSSIDIINSTLNNMSSSMNNASSDVKSYTENIIDQYKELLDKLQDKLNGNNDNDEKIEDFVDDISKDIENSTVADDIHGVADTVDSEIRTIADSIERISAQIKNIGNTVTETMDVVTSDDDYIEDISSADSAQNSDGVIAKSVNRGAVHGDINAGGIAGTMNVEYDVDPEYDLDITETTNVRLRSTVSDVVIYCINYGEVNSKKDCAGGIVGLQELGLVYGSEGYGTVKSETGNYAGGIAGNSASAITDSYSLCNVESEDYTGGICGKGYTMQNCISIPAILGDGEAKGSLAGIIESDGEVSTNIFVNDIYGGIDDINYGGKADSASYEAVMAMENIPDGFHRVTLVFKADGNVIDTKNIAYNANLGVSELPSIPDKDGFYAQWPENIVSKPILQNTVVEAEYHVWIESVAGDIASQNDKPLFIAEGKFYDDNKITLSKCDTDNLSGDIEYSYAWKMRGTDVKDKGTKTCHFYIKNTSGSSEVWYRDNADSGWVKADAKEHGSYMTAEIPYEADFAVIHKESSNMIYYICGGAAACIIVLAVIIIKKRKKEISNVCQA